MSDQEIVVQGADDESELDAALEASLAEVQAGKTIGIQTPDGSVIPTGQTGEAESTESIGATGPTGEEAGDSQPEGSTGMTGPEGTTGATGEEEFRIPNKGKFESDEAYEKRVELFDLVKRRKAATTPEAKAKLSEEISRAKGDLKTLGGTERFTQQKNEGTPTGEADPNLDPDKARAKELGLMTKEDAADLIRQERITQEVQSDLKNFVEKHDQLKDEDMREVFFDFVDNNYVWQGKSGKELSAVLSMAYENMFRPAETMQERVLKGADVARKVNAVQFPGGTGGGTTFSPEVQKSIDELKATGMTEEKAIELLSD